MADYKIVDAAQLDADLTAIADAIRARAGTSAKIVFPEGFASAIRNISGDAEAGEGIEVESLSEAHYWTKTGTVGGTINETYDDRGTTIGFTNTAVQYADEVTLEGNNLVLVNPKSYTLTTDDDAAAEVLVGKYFSDASGFYRIPSDAGIIYYAPTQYTKGHLNATKVYKLSVTPGTEEQFSIIVSGDRNAYPDNGEQDGFTYVYQGVVNAGGVDLPELGDTAAQPTDMVVGKVLYDDKGNPVTGTLVEVDEINEALFGTGDFAFGGTPGGTTFSVRGAYINNRIDGVVVRPGAGLGVKNAPTDFFGDARPEDVTKGKKFTSAAGLLVDGTHEDEVGVELPELTNPATASDMAMDKQLIDADGNVVTGTLPDGGGLTLYGGTPDIYIEMKPGKPSVKGITVNAKANADRIIRAGDEVSVGATNDQFGDAMPGDVRKGKTFTSAAGLLKMGELEVQSFTVTDDGAGNVTITSSAITDNNGNVVIE